MLANNSQFLVNFCFLNLLFLQSCICWKQNKNSVFSRAQLLCITDSKNPLSRPLHKMALLQPKVPFWVFPCACWNPCFCSVWWFCMVTKMYHFPKTDSVNENVHFYLPNTNSVCLFSKNAILAKNVLFTTTQKCNFSVFDFSFCFSIFLIFLFCFLQHKKTKTKTHFCWKPYLTPRQPAKKIFATLHNISDFTNTKKNFELGGKAKKKSLDQFLTQPWTIWPKQRQILDQFSTLQHARTHIYIYAVGSVTWPHFGQSRVNNLATIFWAYKNRVFWRFFGAQFSGGGAKLVFLKVVFGQKKGFRKTNCAPLFGGV